MRSMKGPCISKSFNLERKVENEGLWRCGSPCVQPWDNGRRVGAVLGYGGVSLGATVSPLVKLDGVVYGHGVLLVRRPYLPQLGPWGERKQPCQSSIDYHAGLCPGR